MRKPAKTIDQVEAEETFIFREVDANKPAAEDKRKAPKEFEIVRVGGLYRIKYTAGGEVPDELKGAFTNIYRAQDAIDNVLALRKQAEAK